MFRIHRLLVAYAIAIPLALFLGYLVATPDMASIAVLGMVLFVLVIPLLLQWSHPLLIFCWNSAFAATILPGQIQMWVIFAGMTLCLGLVHRFMGHKNFLRAPELTKPILFLMAVVLATAKIRGGLGLHVLGSSNYGGKNYFFIGAAILGYFALTSQSVAIIKGQRTAKWFFLAGITNGISNVAYALGPAAWFLFWIIPPSNLAGQLANNWTDIRITRFEGFGQTGEFIMCFALARWGIRPLFEWHKPWRMAVVAISVAVAVLSGFRSQLALLIALFAFQFVIEGCWKTALLPVMVLLGLLCATPLVFFADKLPGAVQRSLAFLPLHIDPGIREETRESTQWRLDMWAEVLPDLPKYLLIGKGYAVDPNELYLTAQAAETGRASNYEALLLAGDYHNGPLSILMPLGLFGFAAFLWLMGAGTKVLYCNCRYGDARLKRVNRTLLAYYLAQALFFFFVFGAFAIQLATFLGVLGLSVSLNGGVCRKPATARQQAYPSSLAVPVAA